MIDLKLRRTFYFKKEKHWKEDGTYSEIRDTAIINFIHKLAGVYEIRIISFDSNPWTNECYIVTWSDKASFNAFVADVCDEFETYIENIKY